MAYSTMSLQNLENASQETYVRPSFSVSPLIFDGFSFLLEPEYWVTLPSVLVDESSPLHVRNATGLALKNDWSPQVHNHFPACLRTLPSRLIVQTDYSNRWLNLNSDAKTLVAFFLLSYVLIIHFLLPSLCP